VGGEGPAWNPSSASDQRHVNQPARSLGKRASTAKARGQRLLFDAMGRLVAASRAPPCHAHRAGRQVTGLPNATRASATTSRRPSRSIPRGIYFSDHATQPGEHEIRDEKGRPSRASIASSRRQVTRVIGPRSIAPRRLVSADDRYSTSPTTTTTRSARPQACAIRHRQAGRSSREQKADVRLGTGRGPDGSSRTRRAGSTSRRFEQPHSAEARRRRAGGISF